MIAARLMIVSLIPIIMSVVFYFVTRLPKFRELSYRTRQIIIGLCFGIAAVCGTEFGVDVGGATANVRDAAPLCAGLIYGGPAGIIAGVIGGVYRWIAAPWAGTYSRIACSVSTALAGILAAVLRKTMFEDTRPAWNMGMLAAIFMEVLHMVLLFVTHLSDTQQAYTIVKTVTVPMILGNALAVSISLFLVEVCHLIDHHGDTKKRTLAIRIQQSMLLAVAVAYVVTTSFVYVLQTQTAKVSAEKLLTTNIEDVVKDIGESADDYMLNQTKLLVAQYQADGSDDSRLSEYLERFGFTEINIVDSKGIITATTEKSFLGFDMASGSQSAEFLILNRYVVGSYVQDFGSITADSEKKMKYAGVVLEKGGFLQAGYDEKAYHENLNEVVEGVAQNRRIGQEGYILIADYSGAMLSDHGDQHSETISETGLDLTDREQGVIFTEKVYGQDSMCIYYSAEGFTMVGVLPTAEIYDTRDTNIYVNSFMQVITFAMLFAVIFYLVKIIVVNDIQEINESLKRIIGGKLDERIEISSSRELEELSGYINDTVETLNRYISEAAERMKKDLDLAKEIQHSALPCSFPPYPEISAFDIYATMNTAREVGGDFYDFFLLGGNRMAFVVADVSGKGIPAAMFMMRAKTLIKSQAETGKEASAVITEVNNSLCQNNDAGMFVTAWFGILDYSTGHVVFVNAGHNPPLVMRKDTGYEYLKSRAGLVLAGMEGVPYRTQELDLAPGDRIFLYTDGVTEATSIHTELYGEDRLKEYLNAHREDPISRIPAGLQEDIDRFIEGADQFDDITMLVLEYRGMQEEQPET